MRNEFITHEQWEEEFKKVDVLSLDFSIISMISPLEREYRTYKGYPAILVDDGYIIFRECQYCGKHSPERGLYGYWICRHCGAPIT